MHQINENVLDFKLTQGYSAETSGGLFVIVPQKQVQNFTSELKNEFDQDSWIVGSVTPGTRQVNLRKDIGIVEV